MKKSVKEGKARRAKVPYKVNAKRYAKLLVAAGDVWTMVRIKNRLFTINTPGA